MNDQINYFIKKEIYPYGSNELLKFEEQLERYFEKEYARWENNKKPPEDYGVSSFEGDIVKKETSIKSIDHYNKQIRIYQSFLDVKYMVYTMAYYGATDKCPNVNNDLSLEQAQIAKYDLIIKRADLHDGQTVLELGCGFGGFASYLHKIFPNIEIVGINPSEIQTSYIDNTLSGVNRFYDRKRLTLVKKYFDDLTPSDFGSHKFDRVVSIGVLEAVTNMEKLSALISSLLHTGGKVFHHYIVSKNTIPQFLNAENTLMAEYFPGGHIWPFTEAMRHDRYLIPEKSWFVNGMNYWKTLDDWHQRFWNSIYALYPESLTMAEIKYWNRYFSLCKTMFSPHQGRSYGNGQYLYTKS